jgi:hypothetical protein
MLCEVTAPTWIGDAMLCEVTAPTWISDAVFCEVTDPYPQDLVPLATAMIGFCDSGTKVLASSDTGVSLKSGLARSLWLFYICQVS